MAEIKMAPDDSPAVTAGTESGLEIRSELRETVFDRLLLLITSAIFCLVVLFVILQVLIRYVTVHIGFSMPWTEEAARYLLIFITFFGSAIAWRKREHITITTLVDYFPPKAKLVLDIISSLLILLFLAVAIKGSYSFTVKMIEAPVGAIGWLKIGHIYGIIMAGLLLMVIYQIRWLWRYATEIRRLFFGKGRVLP